MHAPPVGVTYDDLFGDNSFDVFSVSADIIELDYYAGSIGVDLGLAMAIERIELLPDSPIHRLDWRQLEVYTSSDNENYTEVTDWQLIKHGDGSLEILLSGSVDARYLKVHSTFDDRDAALNPVNAAEFANRADEMIRVYAAPAPPVEDRYVYDEARNRIQERFTSGGTSVTYDSSYYAGSHRLKTNGPSDTNGRYGFVWDENGNLSGRAELYTEPGPDEITLNTTTGERYAYQWDLTNRLLSVEHNGADAAHYHYSPRGLRVKKSGHAGTTYYVFDQWGNVIYEATGSDYQESVFAFGRHLGRIDGTIDAAGGHTESARYFYHTDHLGTAEAMSDSSGAVVWQARYDAFGRILSTSGSVDQTPLYTGKAWDADAGLYYFNARWYDPSIGRFISEDPVKDGLNWFVYVGNNPLVYVDPTGLRRSREERQQDRQERRSDRQERRSERRSDRRDGRESRRNDREDRREQRQAEREAARRERQQQREAKKQALSNAQSRVERQAIRAEYNYQRAGSARTGFGRSVREHVGNEWMETALGNAAVGGNVSDRERTALGRAMGSLGQLRGRGSGDSGTTGGGIARATVVVVGVARYFTQGFFDSYLFEDGFAAKACAATSLLNELSEAYTQMTGDYLEDWRAEVMMMRGVVSEAITPGGAVADWRNAANAMWGGTTLNGSWDYDHNLEGSIDRGQHEIYRRPHAGFRRGRDWHFVNGVGTRQYFDPYSGSIGSIDSFPFAEDDRRSTRDLFFRRR